VRLKIAELARKNKNWTMKRLADELEIEHQNVMYWNHGRAYPRLPDLVKVCRLLDCTFEELLEEDVIQAGPPLEYVPERRKGHAPQIVTGYRGGMGAF